MGTRGPIPKRAAQRLGHMTRAERGDIQSVKVSGPVKVPPMDRSWHRIAKDWYRSLSESGQSQHFEPSDWQAARMVAAEMSRMLEADFPSPTLFKAIWSAMDALLTTEGARRRVKLEVDRRALTAAPAPVAQINDYRDL